MIHRWFYIGLCLMMSLPLLAQDGLDTTELEFLLDDYVAATDPAVVLYVDQGADSWVGVRGLADLDAGVAATSDDLFRIGSVTKPLVATVVLQLVDAGAIALDDPIADYLPPEIVANVANADVATVREMLQMTSGIPSYTQSDAFDDDVFANPTRWWTPEATLTYVYDQPADFEAGTDYFYSNSNYNLAQILIETVTDMPLAQVLDEMIFTPLEMTTCYLETDATFAQEIVRGYALDDDGQFYDVTSINDGVGMGDGGVICTARDLAKFPRALYAGDLIDFPTLDAMLTTVEDGDGGAYGLGIGYEDDFYGWQISHDGSTSGFQSNMAYLVDEDVTVIILTNNFDSDLVADLTLDAQAVALGDY